MKTTFTIFLMVTFVALASANNPLSKRFQKERKQKNATLKAAQSDYKPTSVVTDFWDGSNWQVNSTTHYTYNGEGLVSVEQSEWNRTTYTYYVSGMLQDEIHESWDGFQWNYDDKRSYKYDEQGYQSEYTNYYWNGSDWILQGGDRVATVYDSNGDATEEIFSYYDSGSGMWVETDGYKTDYFYSNGLIVEEIEYSRDGGEWVIEMRLLWFYNDQDILESALAYTHDGDHYNLMGRYTDVSWFIWDSAGHTEDSYINTYTMQEYGGPVYPNEEPYNAAHYTNVEKVLASYPEGAGDGTPPKTVEVYQSYTSDWMNDSRWTWEQRADYESYFDESWSGTGWIAVDYNKEYTTPTLTYSQWHTYDVSGVLTSVDKYSEIFDGFGNQIEQKSESHNGDENWSQDGGQKWLYTYDGGTSKVLVKISQYWNDQTMMYVNNMRETFNYTATNLDHPESRGIKIFPTAFQSNLAVQSALTGKVFIYNLAGTKVLERTIDAGLNTINTADLENGYYIVKVSTKQGDSIQKAIKH